MTRNEMNKLRNILETKVMELDRSMGRRDGIVIEMSADQLDRQIGASERDFAFRKLEKESSMLRDVRLALRRMDAGAYGVCVECDEPIGVKRLMAMPAAALCIRCQEAEDCRCAAQNVPVALAMAA